MADLGEQTRLKILCAVDIIRMSKDTVVLTGAGISTHSGIPDFRSTDGGLWERYDPYEVASLASFRYHPEKFYQWIRPLAQGLSQVKPNTAHIGLARLESAGFVQTVITQNVDALHQRAGSKNVLEVHGTLETLTCVSCFHKVNAQNYIQPLLMEGAIPHCAVCGGILKPDVVLYGEELPVGIWLKALDACKKCDLMIVVGSSLEVLPVAGLPMRALERGAHLILINRMATYLDVRADLIFHEDVVEIIPEITEKVLGD